jgi:hypothetical protein
MPVHSGKCAGVLKLIAAARLLSVVTSGMPSAMHSRCRVHQARVSIAKEHDPDTRIDFNVAVLHVFSAIESGQTPDVLVGPHDWIGRLIERGAIEPFSVSKQRRNAFVDRAPGAMTVDGLLYGIPYASDSVALLRNRGSDVHRTADPVPGLRSVGLQPSARRRHPLRGVGSSAFRGAGPTQPLVAFHGFFLADGGKNRRIAQKSSLIT